MYTTSTQSDKNNKPKAQVICSFEPTHSSHLQVESGDIIYLVKNLPGNQGFEGWELAEKFDQKSNQWFRGYVPSSYIQSIKEFKINVSKVSPFISKLQTKCGFLKSGDKENKKLKTSQREKEESTLLSQSETSLGKNKVSGRLEFQKIVSSIERSLAPSGNNSNSNSNSNSNNNNDQENIKPLQQIPSPLTTQTPLSPKVKVVSPKKYDLEYGFVGASFYKEPKKTTNILEENTNISDQQKENSHLTVDEEPSWVPKRENRVKSDYYDSVLSSREEESRHSPPDLELGKEFEESPNYSRADRMDYVTLCLFVFCIVSLVFVQYQFGLIVTTLVGGIMFVCYSLVGFFCGGFNVFRRIAYHISYYYSVCFDRDVELKTP